MYRTARGAFESFDMNLAYAGQTLGLSNTFIFWKIRMPACRQGILAGIVLALPGTGGVRRHKHAHWLYAGEKQPPFPLRFISCGAPMTTRAPFSG